MKIMKSLNFIFKTCFVLLFFACETFDDDIDPVASFELSSTEVSALEVIELRSTGQGEFFTVFKGTIGSQYENRENGDTGIPSNDRGVVYFSYDTAGTFTVTLVATTYVDGITKESVSSQRVSVSDTTNQIDRITFNNIGNVTRTNGSYSYSVEVFPDTENRFVVPVYNFAQYGLTSRSQVSLIPDISISSNASRFNIQNNASYRVGDEVVHYNFETRFRPITYQVIPQTGDARDYLVSVLEIPQFQSFSIGGASGTSIIHPIKDQVFFMAVPLMEGSNASALSPDFTLYTPAETTVLFEDAELVSGVTSLDLREQVKLDLLFEQEGFENIFSIRSSTYVRAVDVPRFTSFSIDGIEGSITQVSTGNPAEYYIDLVLPLPAGTTPNSYLSSLSPVFETAMTNATTEVSTQVGLQISGESQGNFISYYNEYIANPNSFELDEKRSVYRVENYFDAVVDGTTIERAYSLESIYRIGVLIE